MEEGLIQGIRLSVTRQSNGEILIDFNPRFPPQIFFDTNVLLGLNHEDIAVLQKLKLTRKFKYRYSMLNFVELASHFGDEPNKKVLNPFRKHQAAFEKISIHFEPMPLPTPESVFMKGVGLYDYLGPSWNVNEAGWVDTINFIVGAKDLAQLQKAGFNLEHYKELRKLDKKWFIRFIEKSRTLGSYPTSSQNIEPEWGNYLGQFYDFLIFRASSEKTGFWTLKKEEKEQVVEFFNPGSPGGGNFLTHFIFLLKKILCDLRNEDANDFYDMLQLLLLRDENLIFVTDDRAFHEYYAGAKQHRVVPWKLFKASS